MAETKTIQKGWRFTPEIIFELKTLSEREMRSEQNMIEVLIHKEYERQNTKAAEEFSGEASHV